MHIPEETPDREELLRGYELVCGVALAVLALALWQQGLGNWVLSVVAVGAAGLSRSTGMFPWLWKIAPVPLVLLLGLLLTLQAVWFGQLWQPRPLSDLLLSGAVLAYVVAHFRLQGLAATPLPPDPRRGARPPGPSTRPVPDREMPLFLLTLPLWAALAQFAWSLAPDHGRHLDFSPTVYRTMVILWILGAALLTSAAVFAHLRQRRLRPGEAALYLQDVLWKETRREQRRTWRWLAWARVRWRRRN